MTLIQTHFLSFTFKELIDKNIYLNRSTKGWNIGVTLARESLTENGWEAGRRTQKKVRWFNERTKWSIHKSGAPSHGCNYGPKAAERDRKEKVTVLRSSRDPVTKQYGFFGSSKSSPSPPLLRQICTEMCCWGV